MSEESYTYWYKYSFQGQVRSIQKDSKRNIWITPHLLARRYFYFTNLRSRCIFTRADLVMGRTREPRPPFLLEILYYFYRIRRKIKAGMRVSVPPTPFWIFWIRSWFRLIKEVSWRRRTLSDFRGVWVSVNFAPLANFHTTSCKNVETLRRKSDLS